MTRRCPALALRSQLIGELLVVGPASNEAKDVAPAMESEREVEYAIALCGGDVRAALRATLLTNAFLDAEVERLSAEVSHGFTRGRRLKTR